MRQAEAAQSAQSTDAPAPVSHADLVALAEKWLWRQGCGVVFHDAFRPSVYSGERPDAIGWRHNVSILVECKATRSDFLADRMKPFRAQPASGVGDWRFYLCPKGIIAREDLPAGWGLLYTAGRRVQPVCGLPGNTGWYTKRPFEGAKAAEVQMMYGALRRMVVRGHFNAIYDPLVGMQPEVGFAGVVPITRAGQSEEDVRRSLYVQAFNHGLQAAASHVQAIGNYGWERETAEIHGIEPNPYIVEETCK